MIILTSVKEFAEMLNGREIGEEITPDEVKLAKENNIVVVYGASDDLMEFEGAIYDELDAWEGTIARVSKEGILKPPCEDNPECCKFKCVYFKKSWSNAKTIKAVWGENNISWTYETEIPHETFDIMEDGEVYCRGIVFSMDNL